jgi:hypothetical protein
VNTASLPGEQVLKQGPANLHKNIEAVGGRLYLTNRRLVFEAHVFNVQGGVTEIELARVASTRLCWTKLFGVIPLFPNLLAVVTNDGVEHRFVLFGRKVWADAIQAQRNPAQP